MGIFIGIIIIKYIMRPIHWFLILTRGNCNCSSLQSAIQMVFFIFHAGIYPLAFSIYTFFIRTEDPLTVFVTKDFAVKSNLLV